MHTPVSVIFCGTPAFALPSLAALIKDPDCAVQLVITQPDKPVGRTQVLTPPPVKILAEQHGIPVEQPVNVNAFDMGAAAFDFLVTVAYGQVIGPALLEFPKIAPVNVHPSLLPRWRGASPIQHAILADDTETGVTVQQMVQELDAGPILSQERTSIEPHETVQSLHKRLSEMSAGLLRETLKHPLAPEAQEEKFATFCKKLTRADGRVDPHTMTAATIDRCVRALVPWPGVMCAIEREELKILETSLMPADDAFLLPCSEGSLLYIKQLQPPGKSPMTGQAWLRGRR